MSVLLAPLQYHYVQYNRRIIKSRLFKHLQKYSQKQWFIRLYVGIAIIFLLASTILWAWLSARVQQTNADQLASPYLFRDRHTFQGASFPNQHSFLIKWPLFYMIARFGYSSAAFQIATVLLVLITVSALATIMYRLERRRLVFATLCLALGSVLLLVPAEPYAGGLLPVNMAMVTTRNVEYVVYIASLITIAKAKRLRSWSVLLGLVILSLLIASDHLFLSLSVGGALAALGVYALLQRWNYVSLAARWLLVSIASSAGGVAILSVIQASHVTHIISDGASAGSSYAVTQSAHSVLLGILYALTGFLTNVGANPASNTTVLSALPQHGLDRILSISGFAYVCNAIVCVVGVYALYALVLRRQAAWNYRLAISVRQAIVCMLAWSSVAAFGAFIVTKHYYAVDARYLTIVLFAIFIGLATMGNRLRLRAGWVIIGGALLLLSGLLAVSGTVQNFHSETQALAPTDQRNAKIVQSLAHHHVDVLVGDYWRVLPTRFMSNDQLNVLPLQDCTTPRSVLTSSVWQTNLHTHSFAYLLSADASLTDYPHCSLQQITKAYGVPNASVLIAGSLNKPVEQLLFFDNGSNMSSPTVKTAAPATVLPIALADVPHTTCDGPTTVNVVAHQDDDLLFMNPDIQHDISNGLCVRTIYVTAGDSGYGSGYWLSREQGSEAAYSEMLNTKDLWIQRIVQLPNKQFITIANPKGNTKISLIFMHLPDGNLKGQGFAVSRYESLEKLTRGSITTIHSVDAQSSYSLTSLEAGISNIFHIYQPAEIRTQSNYSGHQYPDHSDHMAVGRIVQQAYKKYETQQYEGLVKVPIKFYIGYPTHELPSNVAGPDLAAKQATFLIYAQHDGGVCQSIVQCNQTPTYGSYLSRQYTNPF